MFSRTPLLNTIGEVTEVFLSGKSTTEKLDELDPNSIKRVTMRVKDGSKLAVSYWPTFTYRPNWTLTGGIGEGVVEKVEGRRLFVRMDPKKMIVPPLAFNTAWLAALPFIPAMPPGLDVALKVSSLEGFVDLATGEVELTMEAVFQLQILWGLWEYPHPIPFKALLTTEQSSGYIFHACGERLRNGKCTLVTVARVPETDDPFQKVLLQLPTDALAALVTQWEFHT